MSNVISFINNKPWVNQDSISKPEPVIKSIPDWFREADRFAKDPNTGEYYKAPKTICPFPKPGTTDDYGKIPTWKACPAIFDIMGTGYILKTPCDVEFYLNSFGTIDVKVSDDRYKDFVTKRPPMPQFEHPKGFYQHHFAFWPDWAIKVPDGYSVLYFSPLNRFELPLLMVSGIIDNDKVNLPGTMPFFVREGWTGVLPAGTPYAQLIPFLREDWKSEIIIHDSNQIMKDNMENMKKYRVPDGGVYKNEVWSKRTYE